MTTQVDAAVVGAGVVGLAVAVQLRRAGVHRVAVLDAHPDAGMESSSRANGGVRAQFSTAVNIEFSRATIDELEALDRRSGGRVGLHRIGYLFLAGEERVAAGLRRNFELQHSLGLPVRWLEPGEVPALAPMVDTRGLLAATICPTDGVVDPHGVIAALLEEGRVLGVEYLFDHQVAALEPRGQGLAVLAPGLHLVAGTVVNAAGARAAEVAALAGVQLPVLPYKRNLACTEPAPQVKGPMPMCVDLDTGVLVRREGEAILIGYADPSDPPSTETSFDPGFLEAVAARADNRFPFLLGIPIDERKCWAGLYPETPDHQAIIDRAPGLDSFIQCVGFGGHGIMHSLAAGRAVGELVTRGVATSFDIHALRLSRFQEHQVEVEQTVL